MRLVCVHPLYYLKEDIFGETIIRNKEIEYEIRYRGDCGEEHTYRTDSFYRMITFIKMIYEGDGFQDVIEDPRDDCFFQYYMRGDLVPFDETP